MKIIFENLETIKDTISVDFGDGVFHDYNVNTAKTEGIHIPANVNNYSNIKIRGSISTFRNLDTIAGVKIVNDAVPDYELPITVEVGELHDKINYNFADYDNFDKENFYIKVDNQYVNLIDIQNLSTFNYSDGESTSYIETPNGIVEVREEQEGLENLSEPYSDEYVYDIEYGSGGEYFSQETIGIKSDENYNFVADVGPGIEIPLVYDGDQRFYNLPSPTTQLTPMMHDFGSGYEGLGINIGSGNWGYFYDSPSPRMEITGSNPDFDNILLEDNGDNTYCISESYLNGIGLVYIGDTRMGNYMSIKDYRYDTEYVNSLLVNNYLYKKIYPYEVITENELISNISSIIDNQYLYYKIGDNYIKTNIKFKV